MLRLCIVSFAVTVLCKKLHATEISQYSVTVQTDCTVKSTTNHFNNSGLRCPMLIKLSTYIHLSVLYYSGEYLWYLTLLHVNNNHHHNIVLVSWLQSLTISTFCVAVLPILSIHQYYSPYSNISLRCEWINHRSQKLVFKTLYLVNQSDSGALDSRFELSVADTLVPPPEHVRSQFRYEWSRQRWHLWSCELWWW
jgi:hypothetical protein